MRNSLKIFQMHLGCLYSLQQHCLIRNQQCINQWHQGSLHYVHFSPNLLNNFQSFIHNYPLLNQRYVPPTTNLKHHSCHHQENVHMLTFNASHGSHSQKETEKTIQQIHYYTSQQIQQLASARHRWWPTFRSLQKMGNSLMNINTFHDHQYCHC